VTKFSSVRKNNKMRKEGTLNYSKGFRNPTWFPILDGAVQTIMPFTQDDEEIFGHVGKMHVCSGKITDLLHSQ